MYYLSENKCQMWVKIVCLFIGIFVHVVAFNQQEANTWYFGQYAGVSFANQTVTSISGSKLSTEEGCSVISDKEGRMLFYTDGISVWNASHQLFKNGQGLLGDPSSTQSSVAIPAPKRKGSYYLFTIASTGKPAGICYSFIDMSLQNGLGDVVPTEKNIQLKSTVTEKMTAVTHRNGTDVWVIAHGWKNDEFYAFLVTDKGVSKTPVVSKVGTVHDGSDLNTQGYLKSNPDGTNLALALEEIDVLEIFDFDSNTGVVSQPIKIQVKPKSFIYGIEFSPTGSVLYVSAAGNGEIYQYNLQLNSKEAIQASGKVIGKTPNGEWIGALQLANDGKIYFPIYKKEYLGVIHEPEKLGTDCRYENNAVKLKSGVCALGLPTFTQSFFTQDLTQKEVNYFSETTVQKDAVFVLKNIQFDFAKFTLQSTSFVELNKVVSVLKKNPTYEIELFGHTDNIGNKSSNIILSENRATAVKNYLVSKGISANRISVIGYGSSKPIANNETDAGRTKNRRVEFVLH